MNLTDDFDCLIEIISKNRSNYSPEEIAEAENQLRQAVTDSRVMTIKKAKTVGMIVAAIGFMIGLWPVILIPEVGEIYSEWGTKDETVTFAERTFPIFFLLVAAFQIVLGLVLVAGGIGFRMLRHWGRWLILSVIWIYITYCIFAFVYIEVTALFLSRDEGVSLTMVFGGLFVTVIWVLLLWLIQRYFTSQRIKSIFR